MRIEAMIVVEIFIIILGLCLFTGDWIGTDSVVTFPICSIPSLPFNNCESSPHEVLNININIVLTIVSDFGYVFLSCNVYPRTLEWHRLVVCRHWLTQNGGCRVLSANQFTGTLPMTLSALTNVNYLLVPNNNSGVSYDSILDHSIVGFPSAQRCLTKPIHRTSGCIARATHEPSILVRNEWQCVWVCFHIYMRESTSLGCCAT